MRKGVAEQWDGEQGGSLTRGTKACLKQCFKRFWITTQYKMGLCTETQDTSKYRCV